MFDILYAYSYLVVGILALIFWIGIVVVSIQKINKVFQYKRDDVIEAAIGLTVLDMILFAASPITIVVLFVAVCMGLPILLTVGIIKLFSKK